MCSGCFGATDEHLVVKLDSFRVSSRAGRVAKHEDIVCLASVQRGFLNVPACREHIIICDDSDAHKIGLRHDICGKFAEGNEVLDRLRLTLGVILFQVDNVGGKVHADANRRHLSLVDDVLHRLHTKSIVKCDCRGSCVEARQMEKVPLFAIL